MSSWKEDLELELLHELQKIGLDKIDVKSMSGVRLGYFLGQLDAADNREKYGVCTEAVKEQTKSFLDLYHT